MDWINVIIGLAGVVIGAAGLLVGQKIINHYNAKKLIIQNNESGDNIVNEGYSSDEVGVLIDKIKRLKNSQIEEIIVVLKDEFKHRPQIFTSREEPTNAKEGDIWYKPTGEVDTGKDND